MDIVLVILGIAFLLAGIIGCFAPILPGPPIGYLALIALNFHSSEAMQPSGKTLLWYGVAVAIITVIDYFLPIWGTKKFGGTEAGKRGSLVGLILSFIFPIFGPLTILAGPFFGALVGELIGGQSEHTAMRSAIGSFLGFIGGVVLKLGVVIAMAVVFVKLVV